MRSRSEIPRLRKSTRVDAKRSVADFLAAPKRQRRSGVEPPARVAAMHAAQRSETGDWEDANPSVLVGLYAHCHEQIYGVFPDELADATVWRIVTGAAAAMVRNHFGGVTEYAVDFVRWTWVREEGRLKYHRNQGSAPKSRIGWRIQFSSALVTDWRVAQQAQARR